MLRQVGPARDKALNATAKEAHYPPGEFVFLEKVTISPSAPVSPVELQPGLYSLGEGEVDQLNSACSA